MEKEPIKLKPEALMVIYDICYRIHLRKEARRLAEIEQAKQEAVGVQEGA